jgi:sugar/nucleoside kinase (ribokinase family)
MLGVIGNISRDVVVYPGGRRIELLGGAALHVARAAARAGLASAPISVIGTDLAWIRADTRLDGLDLTHVKEIPGLSCVFRLAYTRDGQVAAIDCAFGAAEDLTAHCLATLRCYDRLHVCCRQPLDVAAVLRFLAGTDRVFSTDFHLASAAGVIACAVPFLPRASVVFVNSAEFSVLTAAINLARLAAVVVSDGPREVALLRYGRVAATVQPPQATVIEVTGAGDTLTGTFLAGAAAGLSDEDAMRAAVRAATQWTREPGLVIIQP